jgi:hypothetical protein
VTTDNYCFYSQHRLIQTSQTGGRQLSDKYSPIQDVLFFSSVGLNSTTELVSSRTDNSIIGASLKTLSIFVSTFYGRMSFGGVTFGEQSWRQQLVLRIVR